MKLNEILNKPVDYEITLNTKDVSEAEFQVGSITFTVYISKEPISRLFFPSDLKQIHDKYFDIQAHGVGFTSDRWDRLEDLGTKTIIVFSSIVDFIKKQIDRMDIKFLAFCAETEKLGRLYSKLAQRFADEFEIVYDSGKCFLLKVK